MHRLYRVLLVVAGTLCVGLAVAGIALPLLPTTPFLLLAAFLYARSSQRFYRWLLGNRVFGAYIRNYREGRGMSRREKVVALALLWGTLSYAGVVVVSGLPARGALAAVGLGVTTLLLRLPTRRGVRPAGLADGSAGAAPAGAHGHPGSAPTPPHACQSSGGDA